MAINNYYTLAKKLMEKLSDIKLEPRPHFKILPGIRELSEEQVWLPEGMNEFGFIIIDYNMNNTVYKINISFKIKTGPNNFNDIKAIFKYDLGTNETQYKIEYEPSSLYPQNKEEIERSTNKHKHSISLPMQLLNKKSKKIDFIITFLVLKENTFRKIYFRIINQTKVELFRTKKTFESGNFLDFKITLSSDNDIRFKISEYKGYGLLPHINQPSIGEIISAKTLILNDHYIGNILMPTPLSSNKKIEEINKELEKEIKINVNFEEEIIKAVIEILENKGHYLYLFQVEAIKEILKQLYSSRKPVVLTAHTAAGKTEAFLLPTLDYILKLKKKKYKGVKAIFLYPTKALANDQLQRIFEWLYIINNFHSVDNVLTIGILHGDIEEKIKYIESPLPLKCPKCKEKNIKVRVKFNKEKRVLYCEKCKEEFPFLMVERWKIITKLPDILLITPDMLNYIMIDKPDYWVILGKKHSIKYCPLCHELYFSQEKNTCEHDNTNLIKGESPNITPQIIVLDEFHMFQSIFGGNVMLLMRRLENLLKFLSSNLSIEYKPLQFIAASATIRNPGIFSKNFFNKDIILIKTNEKHYDYSPDKIIPKTIIFTQPKAFRLVDTAGFSVIQALILKKDLKILVFTNTLPTCDMILEDIRNRISALSDLKYLLDKIDGHNSYKTKQERAEIERKFDEGEIFALVATSTLEVGVDFKDIDFLIIYSAPYSVNSYIQRIGRAGRKKHALVITLLNPNDPIDIYYFRNALMFTVDPSYFIEYPPLPKNNKKLMIKHIVASIFEFSHLFDVQLKDIFYSIDNNNRLNDYLHNIIFNIEEKYIIREIRKLKEKIDIEHQGKYKELKNILRLNDIRSIEDTVKIYFENYDLSSFGYKSIRSRYLREDEQKLLREIRGGGW